MTVGHSDGPRVLVVDDEKTIAELVEMTLRYEGFDVVTAGDGTSALQSVRQRQPDLVVLDIMLPDLDGFEVAKRLRDERLSVPIVFLTARDTAEDAIRGLTLGGDDYVTKPFSLGELVARVHAVLRRTRGEQSTSSQLRCADLVLDEDSHEVWRGDRRIELTATEFRLLRYLLTNARRVLSRAQILDHVWEYGFGGDARVLETYISYLRKKVDSEGEPLIHTVRGVGYVLRPSNTGGAPNAEGSPSSGGAAGT